MPDFMRIVRQQLSLPPMKGRRQDKIIEEIGGQLRDLYQEERAGGMDEESALARALGRIPDWEEFASDIAGAERRHLPLWARDDVNGIGIFFRRRGGIRACLADTGRDAGYALRALCSRPVFLIAVVLALALGIGAGIAIFSVVHAVLLRPLPFAEPGRLIYLVESKLPQFPEFSVSPGNFLEWRAQNGTFESMAAYGSGAFILTGAGEPERLRGDRATSNLFHVLGVRPVIGRDFRPEEDAPGSPPVVLLSYGLWQRRFGGDPAVVGRVISLNGTGRTVLGVMPAALQVLAPATALWVPMAFTERERQQYGSHFLRAIGRLNPGVSLARARADLEIVARRLEVEHPEYNTGWRVLPLPLEHVFVRNVRPALLILLCAVGLVLLVACANAANLFLARGMARQKELSIRSALGAGRGRLVRQLFTESVLVAVAGGAVGLALAECLLRALLALAPAALPRAADVRLNLPALAFALALSLLTALVFGLLPSLRVSRADLRGTLNSGGRGGSCGLRRGPRRALVVAEIALATVLLVGSGLLVRSFVRLQQVDPGLVASQAAIARLTLPPGRYPEPADSFLFYQRLIEQVAQLPGVRAAGATGSLPFADDHVEGVTIEGRPPVPQSELPSTNYYLVTPGYFEAMGIRLVRGRLFTEQDGPDSPRVGIINETFTRRLFPGEDPIGKRVDVSMDPAGWQEVVGVVADTKQYGLALDTTSQFYEPFAQLPSSMMTIVVRTDLDPASVAPGLREVVHALDPELPVGEVRTLEELLAQSLGRERFSVFLLGTFAASALCMAVIGLYGILSYAVGQRTLEIGVRLAHGARPGDVLWMVVREGLGLALAGAAVGLAAALAFTRMMSAMLFGIGPADPATLALAPLALVAAAALASLIPGHRAMRTDAVAALRGEQ